MTYVSHKEKYICPEVGLTEHLMSPLIWILKIRKFVNLGGIHGLIPVLQSMLRGNHNAVMKLRASSKDDLKVARRPSHKWGVELKGSVVYCLSENHRTLVVLNSVKLDTKKGGNSLNFSINMSNSWQFCMLPSVDKSSDMIANGNSRGCQKLWFLTLPEDLGKIEPSPSELLNCYFSVCENFFPNL